MQRDHPLQAPSALGFLRGSLVDCERDKPCQVYYHFRVVEGGVDGTLEPLGKADVKDKTSWSFAGKFLSIHIYFGLERDRMKKMRLPEKASDWLCIPRVSLSL